MCELCGEPQPLFAEFLGVCPQCSQLDPSRPQSDEAHAKSRDLFNLPRHPPRTPGGVICKLCGSECQMGDGERGFCGLRFAKGGKVRHIAGTPDRGVLHWYRDPLPTNCVADWVCKGSDQFQKHNLAVFYQSCTLDCLFCQNWHFREVDPHRSVGMSASELVACANTRTYCVCYFGGDPASQMPHALASANRFADKGVVVCWETAGTANPKFMDRALQLSQETGGCVKFDLKAYSNNLHRALTGRDNHQTLRNFSRAAALIGERPDPPLLVASTLLVPGYVSSEEVGKIARFIAKQDPDIPYALLGFTPHFLMPDLPATSQQHAEAALNAAKSAGLSNVRIGNRHVLGWDY